jgi:tetratricopeptide (TPR) repeat protein
MPPPDQNQSIEQARLAAKQGNFELADALYSSLMSRPNSRLEAISFLAFHRFLQQRYEESCLFAKDVLALRSDDRARINLALSQFGAGDHAGSETTLSQLGDGHLGYAPLLRAALYHRRGANKQALAWFESYLKQCTDNEADHARLPPLITRLFGLARQVREETLRSIHQRIVDNLLDAHGEEALRRIRRAIAHFHDKSEPLQHELQQPTFFYVPGLPPKPWFERTDFSWVGEFELRADAIHAEYQRIIAGKKQRLKPYITAEQNAPQTSWGHLIGTDNWLSLHVLKGGMRVEPNASDMPITMAALKLVDLPNCAGNSPEAFFSTLSPRTDIPPHHGLANYKLVGHLALDIPGDCGIRVGGQARRWHEGKCLFFDDSFVHEAWNHSGRHRTVLIFDVWHPALTTIEKAALTRLFAPIKAFYDYRLSTLE